VKDANISSSQKVITDVATRWNSTYLMLEVASKYEEAFNRLEDEDPSYVSELLVVGGSFIYIYIYIYRGGIKLHRCNT
jgi:dihydrofolate reductase